MSHYIYIMDDPAWKTKSLNDNVYFTLRDIYANVNNTDTCYEATEFTKLLTNGILSNPIIYYTTTTTTTTNNYEYTNTISILVNIGSLVV